MWMRTIAAAAMLFGAAHMASADSGAKKKAYMVETEFGRTGDPEKVSRTFDVKMTDKMRFEPSTFTVKVGETIRFRVINSGGRLHEMIIGTEPLLLEHAALMKKFPKMEHDEPYMTHVKKKKEGEIVWTFDKPGTFHFACLVLNHFQLGMRGTIEVLPGSDASTAEN